MGVRLPPLAPIKGGNEMEEFLRTTGVVCFVLGVIVVVQTEGLMAALGFAMLLVGIALFGLGTSVGRSCVKK